MKKYLSILLIFFLLFGFAVPAFAETISDVIPPPLDSTGCDSYVITSSTLSNGNTTYYCLAYDSSTWDIYAPVGRPFAHVISFNQSPGPLKISYVSASSYDSTADNNGWGLFEDSQFFSRELDDGSFYYYAQTNGDILLSNRDIPYATINLTNKSLDYTGEFFFTLTPPLVVEVEKALNLFQTQTIQTIMIILLCGIGCLALLISLPLLRKVLLRFLNR